MTPDCVTCGCIVEWLRSCYRSQWRLFRGRDTLTRGYYYFADDNAPCYDGEHNYGSRNWTTDDRQGEAPPLGEDEGNSRPWYNGSFPVPRPPGRPVGAADCLRNGEETFPPSAQRSLIAGVDSRCWTDAGLLAPLAPPWCPWAWHRPETLDKFIETESVPKWVDSTPNGRDLKAPSSPAEPQYFSMLLGPRLRFQHGQLLLWNPGVAPADLPDFGTTYSLYVKGFTSSKDPFTIGLWGPKIHAQTPNRSAAIGMEPNFFQYGDDASLVLTATATQRFAPILLAERRNGTMVQLLNEGVDSHTLTVGASHLHIAGIACSNTPGDTAKAECFIFEVIVYDRFLDDSEHAAVLAYFAKRYP